MEKQIDYIDDMTNRYIYQVMKHLPKKVRSDIEAELRTLINDMLEERSATEIPTKEDMNSVLMELGNPHDLAQKYNDKSHYLIGPAIYPAYRMVLNIVIGATLFGMMVAAFVGLFTNSSVLWYEYLGKWLLSIISGLFQGFAWVTIIFAIFERKSYIPKDLSPDWELSSLPPVPEKEISIPIWGPIVGIVMTIFVTILFLTAPQLIGVYHFSENTRIIPFFDLEVLKTALPLFLICFGFGIIKASWEIVEKKISVRYAIFSTIINVISCMLLIIIFTRFPIWNTNFIKDTLDLYGFEMNQKIAAIYNKVTSNFILFIIFVYVTDCISTIYKAVKYNSYTSGSNKPQIQN